MAPLLEENAPNLWALLEAHPDWREAITLPNGKIAALPAIQELAPQNAMWINQCVAGPAGPGGADGLGQPASRC